MKYILLLISCSLTFAFVGAQTKHISITPDTYNGQKIERYAFIVGIDHYQDTDISSFTSCVSDANEFSLTLVSSYGFYHKKKNIVKLPGKEGIAPTRNNIITGFNKLLDRITNPANAVVTIFYSGHGVENKIVPQDAENTLPETFISYKYFTDQLNAKGITKQVHIIDACYAASMGKAATANPSPRELYADEIKKVSGDAIVWFYAVDAHSRADDGKFISLFSKYFIESLEEPKADKNGDGILSAAEVFAEVSSELGNIQPPKFNGTRNFPMAFVGKEIRTPGVERQKPEESKLKRGDFLFTKDGETFDYEGSILNNEPHGYGKATYSNGNQYEGNWLRGEYHGHGAFTQELHGRVVNKYVGNWKNGLREGEGTSTGGSVTYTGGYLKDERHGKGKLRIGSFGVTFKGKWELGKFIQGLRKWDDGDYSDGYYLNGTIYTGKKYESKSRKLTEYLNGNVIDVK